MLSKKTIQASTVDETMKVKKVTTYINPYRKDKKQIARVSLSPVGEKDTQSMRLSKNGLRCGPLFKKTQDQVSIIQEQDVYDTQQLPDAPTSLYHARNGVFLGCSNNFCFVVIPETDDLGVPQFTKTLRAAPKALSEIEAATTTEKMLDNRSENFLRNEVERVSNSLTPQEVVHQRNKYSRYDYDRIPNFYEITRLLHDDWEACQFLAWQGVITPATTCDRCEGELA